MDTPITEKALFAQTRVQQALEAGAHYINADDVREALDGFKGALDCQFGVHNDLLERINGLETQLFHCRVNAGGSEALLSGAISIRDRLVDYFRYVEESVPFAKTAEARERGTAIVDGMSWLIREAGNSRLAVQAVKAQRNQLEAEAEELRGLADRQADLLSRTAVVIRGPEPNMTRWSHHDLPYLAAAMRQQRDICAGAVSNVQWSLPDMSGMECVCPECQEYEHDGHKDDCQVGRACGIYDVLRLTGALPGEKSLSDEAARQADGAWLPWPGGDMPEEAAGKPIDIEQRDGEIFQSLPAESFRWDHLEMDGDVVFWRVSKKAARVGCPE